MAREHDAPEPIKTKPQGKPGSVKGNQVPIYDHKGRRRGHASGLGMSAVGVSRFTGTLDNKIGTKDGRTAWIGAAPKAPNNAARAQTAKIAASLRADKGSNK